MYRSGLTERPAARSERTSASVIFRPLGTMPSVGLERRGLSGDTRRTLKQAYRLLFQDGENLSQAVERVEREMAGIPEVRHLLQFIRSSERGVTT